LAAPRAHEPSPPAALIVLYTAGACILSAWHYEGNRCSLEFSIIVNFINHAIEDLGGNRQRPLTTAA
jgi:hypothetical protein